MYKYTRILFYTILIFFCLFPQANFAWEDPAFDVSQLSAEAKVLWEQARMCSEESEWEAAALLVYRVIEQVKSADKTPVPPYLYYTLGDIYKKLQKYEAALDYLLPITEYENAGYELKARSYSAIAQAYFRIGENNLSHDYGMRAVEQYEMLNDKRGLAKSWYNLGSLFYYQKNYSEALENYETALGLAKEIQDKKIIYSCTAALGALYEQIGQPDVSLSFNAEALHMATEINYTTGISYALHNFGSNYASQGNYEKALEYYQRSLKIKEEEGDEWGMAGDYLAIGKVYAEKRDNRQAINYLKKGLTLSESLNAKVRIAEIRRSMAEAYRDLGDINAENESLRLLMLVRDSLYNEEAVALMGSRKAAYAMQKKESEIIQLRAEKLILESEKRIHKLRTALWIGGFCLIGLIAVFLLYSWHKQKKNALLLLQKAKEIKRKNEKINLQNHLLEMSNQELQNFAYVASHDLKEPLRMVNSFSGLLKRRYDDVLDDRGQEYMYYITDAVERMETLLDDLLDYSRVNTSEKNTEKINTANIAAKIKMNLTPVLEEKAGEVNINFDQMPELYGNGSQFGQLLQNLISNGLKFHNGKAPVVDVTCTERPEDYLFAVKDNGIGISEENQKKIFEMFTRLHTREQYAGTGIGLSTCKKIVERHGGKIWVESADGQGSTFYFTVAKNQ